MLGQRLDLRLAELVRGRAPRCWLLLRPDGDLTDGEQAFRMVRLRRRRSAAVVVQLTRQMAWVLLDSVARALRKPGADGHTEFWQRVARHVERQAARWRSELRARR